MKNINHLKFNDRAPDLELLDADGKPVRLSALWKKQAIVLAFPRHFGCPQCKEMVTMLAHASKEMEANGLRAVVVTQGTPQEAKAFCKKYARGVLCLSDPERPRLSRLWIGTRKLVANISFAACLGFQSRA